MNVTLIFLILARNGDGEDTGWSQMLVFLVLAVFWIVGGIMKAKTQKANRQQQKQKPQQGSKHFQRPDFQQVQKPAEKVTKVYQQAQAALRPEAAAKKVEKFQEQIPKPVEMAGAVKQAERKIAKPAEKTVELVVESERLLIPEDTQQLKTAILHYEILGKPLALREENRI